ncbi:MAG TPA: glycosyltransferase family 9 protein [Gaiellaceae bacterium]|nr:glycosyltransferase family 9 protein [Gaiellaceae bacterium]
MTGVPALRALRAAFPDERLVLAAPAALAPLAALTGAVDAVVDTAPLRPLGPGLHGADLAVNLHGRGPESHRILLASRPRRLLAFEHPDVRESRGLPAWRAEEHEVERWCRLLRETGIPADPDDLALAPPAVRVPPDAAGATIVHPGAASPARRWPPERFAAVARAERARGRRVLVTGGNDEVAPARRVAGLAGLSEEAVLAGRTSPLELAALVAAAGRVVCGDTGVAHLATALATPSVILFGPTSPALWGPPPGRSRHRALWAGRTGDPHASAPDAGLLAIEVADVLRALAELDRERVAA